VGTVFEAFCTQRHPRYDRSGTRLMAFCTGLAGRAGGNIQFIAKLSEKSGLRRSAASMPLFPAATKKTPARESERGVAIRMRLAGETFGAAHRRREPSLRAANLRLLGEGGQQTADGLPSSIFIGVNPLRGRAARARSSIAGCVRKHVGLEHPSALTGLEARSQGF